MSEQADKPLHDWVRQSLDTYRPDYDPRDWARMQRVLRRRRWWSLVIVIGSTCILMGFLGWLLYTHTMDVSKVNVTITKPKLPIAAGVSKSREPFVLKITRSETRKVSSRVPKAQFARRPNLPEQQRLQTPAQLMAIKGLRLVQTPLNDQIHPLPIAFSPEETAITQQMLTGEFGADSTSYRTLDRNIRQWPDAVIVCDLTTSMYPYTTQLFAWFAKNAQNPATKGMVFFTDCDSLGRQTHPGGPPGRMYITQGWNTASALPMLLHAARNTIRNKDEAENDVEALLVAQNQFPRAKHLVLIADNLSNVKDMALLAKVKKPVHVVLCGTTGSDTAHAFQQAYYTIASQTNGSLHTLEDDIEPTHLSSTTTVRVGLHYYRYSMRRKQFKLTPFQHRPRRFLKFIWL
jgi:hypothetical protein